MIGNWFGARAVSSECVRGALINAPQQDRRFKLCQPSHTNASWWLMFTRQTLKTKAQSILVADKFDHMITFFELPVHKQPVLQRVTRDSTVVEVWEHLRLW